MEAEKLLPLSNLADKSVHSPAELGDFLRHVRKAQQLTQKDIVGLGNTGNRLIVDIENGKPTVQLQKIFDLLALLGLEMSIKPKSQR